MKKGIKWLIVLFTICSSFFTSGMGNKKTIEDMINNDRERFNKHLRLEDYHKKMSRTTITGTWYQLATPVEGYSDTNGNQAWWLNIQPEPYYTGETITVFCLESDKHFGRGQGIAMNESGNLYTLVGNEISVYLARLGYENSVLQNQCGNLDDMIAISMATQNIVWEKTQALGMSSGKRYIGNNGEVADRLDYWQAELKKRVESWDIAPSFTMKDGSALPDSFNVGDSFTITDKNKVLQYYKDIIIEGGLNYSVNGNDITITIPKNYSGDSEVWLEVQRALDDEISPTPTTFLWSNNSDDQKVSALDCLTDPGFKEFSLKINKFGSLELTKTNKDNALLNGAVVRVWSSNGYDKNHTVTNGKIVINDLLPGDYFAKEVTAPNGYLLNPTEFKVTIEPNKTSHLKIVDNQPTGSFKIVKKNADKSAVINGTTYHVWNASKSYDKNLTTDSKGEINQTGLDLGTYYYQEIKASHGYLIDSTVYSFELKYKDQNTTVIIQSEERLNNEPTYKVKAIKEDSETGNVSQGDSTLAGAVYELRAGEDIYNKARTVRYYKKDELIATRVTDIKGNIEDVSGIKGAGQFYWQEIQAPKGYNLNPDKTEFTLSYQDQNTSVVIKEMVLKDTVIKNGFKGVKFTSDGSSGLVNPVAGAELTVMLESDYQKYGWDSSKFTEVIQTDEHGEFTSSLYPYGKYRVKETKVPSGLSPIPDFFIYIEKDVTVENYHQILLNDSPIKTYVEIEKRDTATGNLVKVANAEFRIKDSDGNYITQKVGFNKISVFKTDENGKAKTPLMLLPGYYFLCEVKAPNGYLLNVEEIEFQVGMNGVYDVDEDGDPITVVEMYDKAVTGKVVLSKVGEKLTSFENGQFIYEERPLENVEFKLIADEDILSSDTREVVYPKDTVIDTLITDVNGNVEKEIQYLGKYRVEEFKTVDGFVLNTDPVYFELSYAGQEVPLITEALSIKNERQKIEVLAVKKDSENDTIIPGAVLGLYAQEDIQNIEGNVIVEKDTLLSTVTTQNKSIAFDIDLPVNIKTYIQEIKAPHGYVLSDLQYPLDLSSQHDFAKLVFINEVFNTRQQATLHIQKNDENNNPLSGVVFELLDKEGNPVKSPLGENAVMTDELGNAYFNDLEVETHYTLKEVCTIDGYVLDTKERDIYIPYGGETQSVVIYDSEWVNYPIHALFIKKDDSKKRLEGVTFILENEETKEKIEKVTNQKGEAEFNRLKAGSYVLSEIGLEGYEAIEPQIIEIFNQKEPQVFTIINKKVIVPMPSPTPDLPAFAVDTGDPTNMWVLLTSLFVSMGIILKMKGKKVNEDTH